jgi:hypothetical protein
LELLNGPEGVKTCQSILKNQIFESKNSSDRKLFTGANEAANDQPPTVDHPPKFSTELLPIPEGVKFQNKILKNNFQNKLQSVDRDVHTETSKAHTMQILTTTYPSNDYQTSPEGEILNKNFLIHKYSHSQICFETALTNETPGAPLAKISSTAEIDQNLTNYPEGVKSENFNKLIPTYSLPINSNFNKPISPLKNSNISIPNITPSSSIDKLIESELSHVTMASNTKTVPHGKTSSSTCTLYNSEELYSKTITTRYIRKNSRSIKEFSKS